MRKLKRTIMIIAMVSFGLTIVAIAVAPVAKSRLSGGNVVLMLMPVLV
jgi:hypothetical protein